MKALKQTKLDYFYRKKSPNKKNNLDSLNSSLTDRPENDTETKEKSDAEVEAEEKQSPIVTICDRTGLMDESDIRAADEGSLNSTKLDSFNVSLINCSDLQQSMAQQPPQSKKDEIEDEADQTANVDIQSGDSFESSKSECRTNNDDASWCSAREDPEKRLDDTQIPEANTAKQYAQIIHSNEFDGKQKHSASDKIEAESKPQSSDQALNQFDAKTFDSQVYQDAQNYDHFTGYVNQQQNSFHQHPVYSQYPQQQATSQIYTNGYFPAYSHVSSMPLASYPANNNFAYASTTTTHTAAIGMHPKAVNQYEQAFMAHPQYYHNTTTTNPFVVPSILPPTTGYFTNQQPHANQPFHSTQTNYNYNQYSKPAVSPGYMAPSTPPPPQHPVYYQQPQQQQQQQSPQQNSSPTYATLTSYNSQYTTSAPSGFYNHGSQINYMDQQNHQSLSYPSPIYTARQMGSPTYWTSAVFF